MTAFWPRGWAAAAAAWPNLKKLHWEWDADALLVPCKVQHGSTSSTSESYVQSLQPDESNNGTPETASMIAPSCQLFIEAQVAVSCSHSLRVSRDICLRFRQLKSLTVMNLPCKLTVDVSSPVVDTFQHLQYLRLMVSRGNSVFEECWALQ